MIKLGVIGTNWISHQFVKGAIETGAYELAGVYSRKITSAEEFGSNYVSKGLYSNDIDEFLSSKKIDTVYIASPNSLHFRQAKAAIMAGKHVIVEKPAFSTPAELDEIIQLSQEQSVYFFEAARNIHEQNFQLLKSFIASSAKVQGASFTYMKYSSRYDEVLKGNIPNIFSTDFSGGSLMDLGVYLVYAAVGWFGVPQSVEYFATKISTGVDGSGIGILRYEDFDVTIHHGKTGDSFAKSEIYFENGTLVLNGVNVIQEAIFYNRPDESENFLQLEKEKNNPLYEEAEKFAKMIESESTEEATLCYKGYVTLTREVNQVIYDMRQQANIVFAADNIE